MLYDGSTRRGTISYEWYKSLLSENKINVPTITREEIEDRGKSDGLSKLIAMGQTGWFALQCVVRKTHKLPLIDLELAGVRGHQWMHVLLLVEQAFRCPSSFPSAIVSHRRPREQQSSFLPIFR